MNTPFDPAPPESPEQRYFRLVEELFVALRGAPILLSPADWQVAQRWYAAEVPLDLIGRTLRELVERRRARGRAGRINGLRYFDDAVMAAFAEVRGMQGVAGRRQALPLDVPARLALLADRLPADLPGVAQTRAVVLALAAVPEPQSIEDRLVALERELIDAGWAGLDRAARETIDGRVAQTMRAAADRVAASERRSLARRIRARLVRGHLRLPVLSLFVDPPGPADD